MQQISIIVPIYNALEDVKILLESLERNFNFNLGQVILINDCSNRETSDFLSMFCEKNTKFKLIINEENLGFIKTCNKGLRIANSEIVVLLNSDTIVPKNFAEKIIKCFKSDKNIGLASPISSSSNAYYINLREGVSIEEMNTRLEARHKRKYPMLPEAEGFCFCIRKEVITSQGYLDEIYGKGYHEEVDYSYRALTNGWKIVLIEDLYVYHKSMASFGNEQREKQLKQNDNVFYSRWEGFRQKYKEKHKIINPVIEIENEIFKSDKVLVHLHLYYHNQLDYMIKKLKNISDCDWDLYITYCDYNKISENKILRFKPNAKLIKVENIGYDILPFIHVLKMVNLDNYASVLKIHTKNYCNDTLNFIGINYSGYFWRNSLINALLGSKSRFIKNKNLLKNTPIGMIFDDKFLFPLSKNCPEDSFLLENFKKEHGIKSDYNYFCAGTMFMMKSSILKEFLKFQISKKFFDTQSYSSDSGKFVHVLERIFTILTVEKRCQIYTVKEKTRLNFIQKIKPKKEKISFIMTNCNDFNQAKKSIDSLLNQTNQNYELVIINNKNNLDFEKNIKKSFYKEIKTKKIRYISYKKNENEAFLKNYGIKQTKNPWIAYLNSNIKLKENYIEEFILAIKNNPERKIFYSLCKDKNNIIGENFRYDEIRERNFINIGAFVHHKSIIKKNGVFDTELTNYNWDLIVRYCTNHRPIFINKLLIEDYNEIENFNNNSELRKIKIKFMLYLHEKLKT